MVDVNLTPRAITPDNIKDPDILKKFDDAMKDVQAKLKKADITVPGPYLSGWEPLVVRGLDNPDGPTTFFLCHERCLYLELFPKAYPDKSTYCGTVIHFLKFVSDASTSRYTDRE